MPTKIEINKESQVPVYKQIIRSVQDLASDGTFRNGDFLPSLNELADELDISKETVKKAYSNLRDMGMLETVQGKGCFISDKQTKKNRILLIFDNISAYKQVIFRSFQSTLSDTSEISIILYHQDIDVFEKLVEENLGNFDYYLISPHFPLQPGIRERAVKALKRIPNRKLLLIDHYLDELPGNYGAVYQDFEQDVIYGLTQGKEILKQYKKLNVIRMPGSLYAPFIEKGIDKFCTQNHIQYKIHEDFDPEIIKEKEAYLILNSQLDIELIELIRIAKAKGCRIGKDIGIISYNESPINEIILDGLTVLSTDFRQMGELAAQMILEKSFRKIRCDFKLIRRSTF